ncbi:DUF2760 domain-containing protein [Piscinibacter sakaiensis]|uniref:DUF2760 domain-containing protein n=1 Tax=Piscinibacter sakaiensis TaxID=1547922 RepID=UPI003AAA3AF3
MSEQHFSFFQRLGLAFGTFFALLGDGRLAARIAALRAGAVEEPAPAAAPVPPPAPPAPSPIRATAQVDAALQLLGLLQREARLVDFVQEDVAAYADADVAGAARLVHAGCRKVLEQTFTLEPVRSEAEGSRISLDEGFDASAIRLTGNVVGKPPFRGQLSHRGWRATDVRLPGLTEGHDSRIIAAAEVEL